MPIRTHGKNVTAGSTTVGRRRIGSRHSNVLRNQGGGGIHSLPCQMPNSHSMLRRIRSTQRVVRPVGRRTAYCPVADKDCRSEVRILRERYAGVDARVVNTPERDDTLGQKGAFPLSSFCWLGTGSLRSCFIGMQTAEWPAYCAVRQAVRKEKVP